MPCTFTEFIANGPAVSYWKNLSIGNFNSNNFGA
jgi:hypothetical protein